MYATLEGYYDKIEQITSTAPSTSTFRRTTPHAIQANVSSLNVAPSTQHQQKKEDMSIPVDVIDPVKNIESIPIDVIDSIPEQKEEKQEKQEHYYVGAFVSHPHVNEPIPEQKEEKEQKQEKQEHYYVGAFVSHPHVNEPIPEQKEQKEEKQVYSMDSILSQHMSRPQHVNDRAEKAKLELERQQAEQQLAQYQATQMARLQQQQQERFAHMLPPPQVQVSTEQYSPSIRELQDDTMSFTTPTVTLFYAPWCTHCVHMKPIYAEAYEQCKQNGIQVDFTAINGSAWPSSTKKYNIVGFPTLLMFSQGKKHVYAGRRISSDICKWISDHL